MKFKTLIASLLLAVAFALCAIASPGGFLDPGYSLAVDQPLADTNGTPPAMPNLVDVEAALAAAIGDPVRFTALNDLKHWNAASLAIGDHDHSVLAVAGRRSPGVDIA